MKKEKWSGRGRATIFDDDSIEFTPQGQGEPVQKDVKRSGNSKFYKTNGAKESNFVAHLSAPSDAVDPVGDMLKDFEKLTKEIQPVLEKPPRLKPLLKQEDNRGNRLSVYADKKGHRLQVFAEIALTPEQNPYAPADWAYTLIGAKLNSCFTANRTNILSAYQKQDKALHKK